MRAAAGETGRASTPKSGVCHGFGTIARGLLLQELGKFGAMGQDRRRR